MEYNNFFVIAFFILGAVAGSFLNTVALRLPKKISWIQARSRCPHCEKTLAWYELIPFVSFVLQQGKCRKCQRRISLSYPFTELVCGILFAGAFFYFQFTPELIFALVMFAFFFVIFLTDLRYYLILDRVTVPALLIAFLGNLLLGKNVTSLLLGIAIGAGIFLLQFFLSRGTWIGGGDIRLGALLGATLGWQQTILALLIAYVVGAVIAMLLLVVGKKTRKDHIPFGTFLSASGILMILYGDSILKIFNTWYF
ncbi:MAG: hypothetical protein A3B74_02750 [Candidatus Kerfeldbacteria bacterium RIFCSPHIGHO2_02_FULL_42_14]|uniref:Prepilin leader peptidase/N-methyltransferase n=1 Tax=Candidatus Kerfeldbacteria bacterium RIFCSPHIGHO2_02_FULL_42_14 TaxID=1798540 RepID=A0A1G2AUL1_9BACT|nr:MAG: hypothetical protein A3B74_02750 [Candidatus Kerfeldbacteria bacterium RIFCSPHIGHO2_02_FULL_42_14]OGY80459.1 MAG: hypothetical protein A3E60_05370 [Candidatus Kerfeldbacteria bacterium RIFCSPHIGHO2_12_FULL_42_13]OGY83889.1 MAG: hypothetical protein A3I91_04895 [Candidatus Kerfeldbacteria bacterium RIFCSPLOWO2_02_FULL_42_19]OGY86572.1 MAG: hypothetical protein A3G01_04935 [Candidatus Kerfeldbacteria bacterium RIFCSPLOWO2_12_FULL_43_9]